MSIGVWATTTGETSWNNLSKQITTAEYLSVNYLSDDTELTQAITDAAAVYTKEYDGTKDALYEGAYQDLKAICDAKLATLISDAKTALYNKIAESNTTRESVLSYNEFKNNLKTAQAAAQKEFDENEYKSVTDLDALTNATDVLDKAIKAQIAADLAKCQSDLDDIINTATSYCDNELKPVTDVIYNYLNDAIAVAKKAKDDAKDDTNGKNFFAAKETLNTAYGSAQTQLKDFNKAVDELNTALSTADSKKKGYSTTHEAIVKELYDAITAAQKVYDNSKKKKTDELVSAKTTLVSAYTVTDAANKVADDIDSQVKIAQNAYASMIDADSKADLQKAIDDANKAVKEKSDKKDLDDALTAIETAVTKYVGEDLTKAQKQLQTAIDAAKTTDMAKLAYDEYKTELTTLCDEATTKKENFKTAEDCVNYIVVFQAEVEDIVAADLAKAQDALSEAITAAEAVTVENSTIKADLDAAIKKAKEVLEKGTALACVAETATLNDAVASAKSYEKTYQNKVAALAKAIEDATAAKAKLSYTGIQDALQDAIDAAKDVQAVQADKTLYELVSAIDALNAAVTAANNANTEAKKLDNTIKSSETIIEGMVFTEGKEALQKEVDAAKEYFTAKAKTADDYTTENNKLAGLNTKYGTNEKAQIINALNDAINKAGDAKETMAYDVDKTNFQKCIDAATKVKDNATSTAVELNNALETLKKAQTDSIAADLTKVTAELSDSIISATAILTPYIAIISEIENKSDSTDAVENVTKGLADEIIDADKLNDDDKATGAAKYAEVATLATAMDAIAGKYDTEFSAKLQELSDSVAVHKYIINTVKAENSVIYKSYEEANKNAVNLYYAITVLESKDYDLADVCNTRQPENEEYAKLYNEYTAWKKACDDLAKALTNANTALDALTVPDAKADLTTAIDAAKAVQDKKSEKYAKEMQNAIEALNAAVEAAKEKNVSWSFTDDDLKAADSEFQVSGGSSYAAGKITYTRTSAKNIFEGAYGTFCLPMDIDAGDTQFKNVYTVNNMAMYYPTTNTVKLFLNKATGTVKAGTPFLAELNCTESIVLKNNASQKVDKIANTEIYKVAITVYNDESIGFVENTDFKLVWNGSFRYTSGLENCFAFNKLGGFQAAAAVPACRGYIEKIAKSSAKNINIEIEFADEATAIESIEAQINSNNANLYNVAGQRVNNNFKGVVINNGKKYVK